MNEMTLSRSKLLIVFFLSLTGTPVSAEVPVSYPGHDTSAHTKTTSPAGRAVKPGMHWQILPGEDIPQIARLMFPDNARTRDAFLRAVIRKNPELFPDGIYQSIPAGTTIYIPDLRTIGAYAKPARKAHPSNAARANQHKTQAPAQAAAEPGFSHDHPVWQLIAQLEKIAEEETSELNKLLNRIESIEKQIIAMQSLLSASTAPANKLPAEITHQAQPAENTPQPQHTAPPPAEHAITPPQQPNPPPQPADPVPPVEASAAPAESILFADNALLLGILVILLIAIVIVRSYRKIKERLARSRDTSLSPDAAERHQYETLLLRRTEKKTGAAENPPEPSGQVVSEARALIEQENPEAAAQLLQKHLAQNQHDIPGWFLLFELLYKTNNKRDFKKNARRFKRLGEFPDIWQQIQKLGNQLEPNESLYFDEQKRKEKFFSEARDSDK
ncbi:MAG: hypothetical protein JSR71_05235 [Proteobacteria bacterium]|nr:hypothetical protein [Pseudomonadota bacterium]